MGRLEVNVQAKAQDIVGLANAMEQAAANHRWSDVGALCIDLVEGCLKTLGYMTEVDEQIAAAGIIMINAATEKLRDELEAVAKAKAKDAAVTTGDDDSA